MTRIPRVEFDKSLDESLARLEELEELKSNQKSATLKSRMYTINRWIISYLCKFHRLEVTTTTSGENVLKIPLSLMQRVRRQLLCWPYFVLFIYCYCAITVTVNLYYKYPYDILKKRLQLFQLYANNSYTRSTLLARYDVEDFVARSSLQISELRETLKRVGAPHLEWSIAVAGIYSYIIQSTLVSFLLGPYHMQHDVSRIFPCLELFLDPERETRKRLEWLRSELNKFIALSRSYTESQLNRMLKQMYENSDDEEEEDERYSTSGRSNLSSGAVRLIQRHELTIRQLHQLALSGGLKSCNRTREWLDLYVLSNLWAFISIMGYSIIFIVVALLLALRSYANTSTPTELTSWRDVSVLLSAAWLFFTLISSGTFYWIGNSLNDLDHIKSVRELAHRLSRLIERNERRTRRLEELSRHRDLGYCAILIASTDARRPSRAGRRGSLAQCGQLFCSAHQDYNTQWFQLAQQLDFDQLAALLHTQLFEGQFLNFRRQSSSILTGYMLTVVLLPFLMRFLMPYMEPTLSMFALIASVPGIGAMSLVIIPLCYIHCRYLDINKSLWSLLAQLIRLQATCPQEVLEQLNFKLITFILRKKLAHTQHSIDKYSARAIGGNITYANALRYIFYLSLVLLSLFDMTATHQFTSGQLNLVPSGGGLLGRLLSDPLGVYKF